MSSNEAASADKRVGEGALETAPVEAEPDASSKLRTFVGILRKFLGVSDLANVRFSLPAHLLEPTPNLEYWTYLDRPEAFISIGDSEDPVGRMLGVLRFWFTKDLKYIKGKPCKPYNSTLGEFFRCNWEVQDTYPELKHPHSEPASSAVSFASAKSSGDAADKSTGGDKGDVKKVTVSFLTEQTSHHPPVSAFVIECPEKEVSARGYDQIAAKFTGTSVRIAAGQHNYGIYIDLKKWGEEYRLTHPIAHIGGLLRGTLTVAVTEQCYVTCLQTKTKAIINYVEDGWIMKAQNKVEGIIYSYDPDAETNKTPKIRDIPEKDIIARIEGSWMDKLQYSLGSMPFAMAEEKHTLIDLTPLYPEPKICPPLEEQLPNESRRFWKDVTQAIKSKQYSLATELKVKIEDRQRAKAADRKSRNVEWQPRFFTGAVTPAGKPELTKDGEQALQGLQEGRYKLEESKELGA